MGAVVHEMLINLVGDDVDVVLLRQFSDQRQLRLIEDLPSRVCAVC